MDELKLKKESTKNLGNQEHLNLSILAIQRDIRDLQREINISRIRLDRHDVKIDNNEQYSRRTSLKLLNVPLRKKAKNSDIMSDILKEFERLDIPIYEEDVDRCHRTGSTYTDSKGTLQKPVLIKFTSWKARDLLYKSRKSSHFIVKPDITNRVENTLEFAKSEVSKLNSLANTLVEYVFVDCNCKLMIRTKDGKFHGFNTEAEFNSLIASLDVNEATHRAYEALNTFAD